MTVIVWYLCSVIHREIKHDCFIVFVLVILCADNHNYSLILGDKRPYLSLPRPGVSITPSILVNILVIQCFVIL